MFLSRYVKCNGVSRNVFHTSKNMFSKITASMVKELREKSGAPMMDCKKALSDEAVQGDMEKAVDWLRKKGIARATSAATRDASEGTIAVYTDANVKNVTLVEVNSETDFVSRNTDFQNVVRNIAYTAHKQHMASGLAEKMNKVEVNVDDFLTTPMTPIGANDNSGTSETVKDVLINAISVIRENILIKRISHFSAPDGHAHQFGVYVHGKVSGDGSISDNGDTIQMGTQASVVSLDAKNPTEVSEDVKDQLSSTAKKLAMHVIAANPQYLHKDDAPQDVIDRETKIFKEQTMEANANKTEDMIQKIMTGKLNKRLNEMSLLGQSHMADASGDVIEKHLNSVSKACFGGDKKTLVNPLVISYFVKWQLGSQ